ncbi:iron-sulfur cluster binding protein, partial [mine drainage metagenome]
MRFADARGDGRALDLAHLIGAVQCVLVLGLLHRWIMSPAPAAPQTLAASTAAAVPDYAALRAEIAGWARELGFAALGVAGIDLPEDAAHLTDWLAQGQHGSMDYMPRHAALRGNPAALQPGTLRVISVRMDYWPAQAADAWQVLGDGERAYIARYALGRDYHGLMRKRLQKLAERIVARIGPFGYRAFADSAPVLEKALARNAGLGWIGKHTLLLSRDAGSYFFLGELFTDLPLPLDAEPATHCG